MDITFQDLKYYCAIVEATTLTRAAERLAISAPALSMCLARLREKISDELIQLDRKGHRLTPAGRVLYERANSLMHDVESLTRDVREVSGQGFAAVRMGMGLGVAETDVSNAWSHWAECYPRGQLHVEVASWEKLYKLLLSRELDFFVSIAPRRDLVGVAHLRRLPAQPVHWICRRGHPLAKQSKVTLEDLVAYPIVTTLAAKRVLQPLIERELMKTGKHIQGFGDSLSVTCTNWTMVKRFVIASNALTTLPVNMVKSELDSGTVTVLDLPSPLPPLIVQVVALREIGLSPPARQLAELIAEELTSPQS